MQYFIREVLPITLVAIAMGAVMKRSFEEQIDDLSCLLARAQLESALLTFCAFAFTIAIIELRAKLRKSGGADALRPEIFARDLAEELSCETLRILSEFLFKSTTIQVSRAHSTGSREKANSPASPARSAQDIFTRSMMIDYLAEHQGYRRVFVPGEGWLGKRQLEELREEWGITDSDLIKAYNDRKTDNSMLKRI